jgi:2,5-diketo-D-gluconate reductase A
MRCLALSALALAQAAYVIPVAPLLTLSALALAQAAYVIPVAPLLNAAVPGTTMPFTGLGTGGYGHNASSPLAYPECWSDTAGCGPWVVNATVAYLQLAAALSPGQVRLDGADTYDNAASVGQAMRSSGLPRERIFLLSKTGSGQAMGYADTMAQVAQLLSQGGCSYVDALLIHWPTSTAASQEPACNAGAAYNATACRLETWRAYVDVFRAGTARAIGVSNFHAAELQEIQDAGMPLPAVNQIPFNIYRSSSWAQTVSWCQRNGVVVNSYSPYGAPDAHAFPAGAGMAPSPLEDSAVRAIAAAHGRTPAAVLSAWLAALGVVLNPRTYSPAHMRDNLLAFDLCVPETGGLCPPFLVWLLAGAPRAAAAAWAVLLPLTDTRTRTLHSHAHTLAQTGRSRLPRSRCCPRARRTGARLTPTGMSAPRMCSTGTSTS